MFVSNIMLMGALAAFSGHGEAAHPFIDGAMGPSNDFESDIRFTGEIGNYHGAKVAFMQVNSPLRSPIDDSSLEPWTVMDLRGAYRLYEDTEPADMDYPEFAHLMAACDALNRAGEPCSLFDRSLHQIRPTVH